MTIVSIMKLKHFSLPLGAQIFKAFADESRIRIMFLLHAHSSLCISDLEHILGFTQTKTSRHITYLKNAGLLNAKKKNQWVFYEIKEEVAGMVDQVFEFLNKDSQLTRDEEIYQILLSNRELAVNKLELL